MKNLALRERKNQKQQEKENFNTYIKGTRNGSLFFNTFQKVSVNIAYEKNI